VPALALKETRMGCYYHPKLDDVGGCKNCGKGLCKKCAVDLVDGLACKGKCEEKVRALILMIAKGTKAYEKTSTVYRDLAIWTTVVGTIFVVIGFYKGWHFITILGSAFFLGSIFNFIASRRFKKVN
jgi:hypothetical protein